MKRWIAKVSNDKLAHNASWILLSQGLCLVIQAAYFVIIARSLGAQQYGAFVATTAFAQIFSPFVGFGRDNLLVKNVARDSSHFAVYYGNLLFATVVSGAAATVFIGLVARFALSSAVPLSVIAFVSLAELVFARLVDCAAMAFQAIERLDVTAQLKIWSALARLLGIAILAVYMHHPRAGDWSFVYLLATASTATLGLVWVQTRIGAPRLALTRIRKELFEGIYFSVSLSAQSIYNDIDKTMLARMATLDAVGIYATAYRFIDIAFIPVRSVLNAAYPGFFRAGREGIRPALDYMRRLLPKSAAYSGIAFLCLFLCAPIIPYVFGAQYARAVEALRWLALLPFFRSIHFFLADALTCSGHQGPRAFIQIVVAGFNLLINLWIIPRYSWRGAAWSSLASDALLAASMYAAILFLSARSSSLEPATRNQVATRNTLRAEP